jgi:hypothetical protein
MDKGRFTAEKKERDDFGKKTKNCLEKKRKKKYWGIYLN